MADIFISYASEDRDRVVPIVKALEEEGWSTFWDWKSIPVGKTWREFIYEGLEAARCILVLWSTISITKRKRWVLEEADYGFEHAKYIPALIDDVRPPIGFGQIQAANLINWTGDIYNFEFKKLVHAIESILGPSPRHLREAEQVTENERKRKQEEERKRSKAEEETERTIIAQAELKIKAPKTVPKQPKATEEPSLTPFRTPDPQQKITNSIGMEFVLIPAGSFTMGSNIGGSAERPPHKVEISHPFYLQTTEASQGQWKIVMKGDNPSSFDKCGDDCPVEKVNWEDVQLFIRELNKKENTKDYRLPSEAEWEYACRAGMDTEYSFGEDDSELCEYAWYNDNSTASTHRVATRKHNPWFLYDMHGNVLEWVEDDWHSSYKKAPNDGSAWIDKPRGHSRVMRGGYWGSGARDCRSAARGGDFPADRLPHVGFRLAMSIPTNP
jgi:formylglycine-generating enzyme required for sulfatase activity